MSTKISQLTSATDVTANDLIQIVDVEDGVMAPSGTNKKATASLLAKELAKQPLEPGVVISGSSSGDAVRITQTGSGNALVVEDSTNPDSTPTVITASGNVGIGTNSPADKLEVNGNMVCRDSTQFGGFALKNASNTIGYMIGTTTTNDGGQIGLLDGNIEKVIIKSNGNSILNGGNVGIGTNSPTAKLNVIDDTSNDAVRITQTGSGNALVVEDSSNPDATPFVVNNQGFVVIGDTTSRTGPYGFPRGLQLTNQGTQLTSAINNQYGEGIVFAKGRGTPSSPHTIVQLGDALGSIAFTGSDGTDYVLGSQIASFVDGIPGSGDMPSCLTFSTTPDGTTTATERLRITGAGNVGIGTSSPAAKLDVIGSNTIASQTNVAAKVGSGIDSDLLLGSTNGNTPFIASQGAFPLALATNATERMRITSAGNVGIGTSSPSYQLELSTDSAAKPSTSTWTISSDERLKENIEAADLDICYNAVKNIPLKRYKWKDEIYSAEQVADRSKIGWIAQDVQAVFPKAVNEHKFVYNQVKDEDGNIVSEDVIEDCLSLNSDQIYAALFGAVQKLMAEVDTLKERIVELESA